MSTGSETPDVLWHCPGSDAGMHPLIAYLKSRLECLAQVVTFEHLGQPVAYDGFRLRDLAAWSLQDYGSVLDSLGAISGYCNMRCGFCYERGNPLPYRKTMLSVQEARTRAKHYNTKTRQGLPRFHQCLDMEAFTNPWLLEILSIARAKQPDQVLSLTTNGSYLDDSMLACLAALGPLHLVLSLNRSRGERRREIMHDPHPHIAIEAAGKLQSYGIPFTGAITAWPDMSEPELRETIHYLDDCSARAIRVSLPSYSKYFSDQTLFDTPVEWGRILDIVEDEADQIETPIAATPYLYKGLPLIPIVTGVIRNSPAAHAGVRRGDIITNVQGQAIPSRLECKRVLREQIRTCGGLLSITIDRAGETQCYLLDDRAKTEEDLYPYKPQGYASPSSASQYYQSLMGLFLHDDIDLRALLWALELAAYRGAKTVAVLTSSLVEDFVRVCIQRNPQLAEASQGLNVVIASPAHRFWGGNIMIGDLYLCSDYIACIQHMVRTLDRKPDLTLIPSTFSSNYWVDLAGVPYSEIELQTGIPVELVPCARILI